MTHQIEIPEGWKLYAWTTQHHTSLVTAPDEEHAYEAVVKYRQDAFEQTREEAEGWFEKDDRLDEIGLTTLGTLEVIRA